ncbi:hypothetical protein T484DRAFT_1773344 [Baffinella frigidus]|nr:hypothetical protein T484DRAFT_1773344 [Cryptophyta sp. CCMP2293]
MTSFPLHARSTNRRGTTSDSLIIPKGKGRRGEGIRTAERQSGQSCAADFYERRSEVDSEMLASCHISRSLSECAFLMDEDAVCEEAGATMFTRCHSEGEIARYISMGRELSPHDVTMPTFCQRRSEDNATPDSSDLPYKSRGVEKATDGDGPADCNQQTAAAIPRHEASQLELTDCCRKPRKGTPSPRRELAFVRAEEAVASGRAC